MINIQIHFEYFEKFTSRLTICQFSRKKNYMSKWHNDVII